MPHLNLHKLRLSNLGWGGPCFKPALTIGSIIIKTQYFEQKVSICQALPDIERANHIKMAQT